KGNVIVWPQDSISLTSVLPPDVNSVRDTFCALLIGPYDKPTRENIAQLGPCLLRKSRVSTMINFLVDNNTHYAVGDSFHGFSAQNLHDLCPEPSDTDIIPPAVEISTLNTTASSEEPDATGDCTYRDTIDVHDRSHIDSQDILLENVGYAESDSSPV
ncbi:hypothetical protein CPB86DRAFT_685701, partial [Serendipita vermifera]